MASDARLVDATRTTIVLDGPSRQTLDAVRGPASLSGWIRAAGNVASRNPKLMHQIQEQARLEAEV